MNDANTVHLYDAEKNVTAQVTAHRVNGVRDTEYNYMLEVNVDRNLMSFSHYTAVRIPSTRVATDTGVVHTCTYIIMKII